MRVVTSVRKSLKPAGEAQNAAAILYISVLQKNNTVGLFPENLLKSKGGGGKEVDYASSIRYSLNW